jgi:nucleotide-binding universal stress UspA family protein
VFLFRRVKQVGRNFYFKTGAPSDFFLPTPIHKNFILMPNILVPTDFSENALTAVLFAVPFAAHFGLDVLLAHIVEPSSLQDPTAEEGNNPLTEDKKQQAWELMRQHLARIEQLLPEDNRVKITPTIPVNNFGTGIQQLLAQRNSRLIIMGTKGASGLKRIFFGSNATYLIENTPVPLLAIPEKTQFAGVKEAVIAINLKEFRITENLLLLKDMVKAFGASITAVTVVPPGEDLRGERERIASELENMLGTLVKWQEITSGNPVEAIQDYVAAASPDVLVLMPQPKSAFEEIFGQKVTQAIIYQPTGPILIIPYRTHPT